ncbi:MAG TPA: HNH endonuclease [Candidatus Acidoferrum sp.]|nr:HNH endonuclease [Candidatus Acidoferrum sp.]
MKFELEEYHRGITDDELIADLKRVANESNKKFVSFRRYNEYGKYVGDTLARRFGSWSEALMRAGLQVNRHPARISEEELFQNIEEIWVKLGRQPRITEIQKPLSKYSHGAYTKRFGTWRKALARFVACINNEQRSSSGSAFSLTANNAKSLSGLTQGVPSASVAAPQSKPIPDFVAKIAEGPHGEEATGKLETEPSKQHKTKRNVNWRLRFVVMRRDNFKCQKCGRSPATDPTIVLHVDHRIAWANWGETVLENLETLCSKCNIGKSDSE